MYVYVDITTMDDKIVEITATIYRNTQLKSANKPTSMRPCYIPTSIYIQILYIVLTQAQERLVFVVCMCLCGPDE